MAAFLDNCKFTPTAGGTTDWTFSAAVTGYQSPAAAGVVNGTKYKYFASSADLTQWEVGEGAYTTSSGVLARTTVLYNSSGTGTATGQSGAGTKISFSAVPTVAVVAIKEDLLALDEANSFTAAQQAQAQSNIGLDNSRRNQLLELIYQSKTWGLSGSGSYRRAINNFADGFTTTAGINSGSSSNYQFDNINGIVEPTFGPGSDVSTSGNAIVSSTSSGSAAQTADGITTGANGWVSGESGAGVSGVSYAGQNFGGGVTKRVRQMVLYQGYNGDSTYSITSALIQYSDNGTAWTTAATVSLTATLAAQTVTCSDVGTHQYWRLLANSAAGAANRWGVTELQMMEYSLANNMTAVTTTQTADASVSSGRVLLEFDNSATPTLNTDLTVEVTCNGGTNWTAATLSSVTANSQGGRSVAETADTACTSGTSFAARIKTLNNKTIPIWGVSLTVH